MGYKIAFLEAGQARFISCIPNTHLVNKCIETSYTSPGTLFTHLCKHVNTELVRPSIPHLLHFSGRQLESFCRWGGGGPSPDGPGMFRAPRRRPLWTWCSAASAEEEIRTRLIKLLTASVLGVNHTWIMSRRQNIKPGGNPPDIALPHFCWVCQRRPSTGKCGKENFWNQVDILWEGRNVKNSGKYTVDWARIYLTMLQFVSFKHF